MKPAPTGVRLLTMRAGSQTVSTITREPFTCSEAALTKIKTKPKAEDVFDASFLPPLADRKVTK